MSAMWMMRWCTASAQPSPIGCWPLLWNGCVRWGSSCIRRRLARWVNPVVRGWMNYYGEFNRFEMYSLLQRINTYLMRWARKKYKRLRTWKRFKSWWRGLTEREPELFAHWAWMRAYHWIG